MKEVTTTHPALVDYNPERASLEDMRRDPSRFPRIKALPREMVIFEMSKIVSQAFLYRGQTADPTNIQFIASALTHELLSDQQYKAGCLSLAEIQVIVKRAVLGGSEMFGISVASLYKVIIDYAKGEGHYLQARIDGMIKPGENIYK